MNSKEKGQIKSSLIDCHDFRLKHSGKVTKKHSYLSKNLKNPFAQSQKNIVHRSLKNSFGQNHKKVDNQRAHTTLIDILVEDCQQCAIAEKPTASFSNASSDITNDITDCKGTFIQFTVEKKSPASGYKSNCVQSELDLNNTNKNHEQRCYDKISIVDNIIKFKKPDGAKTTEPTKKFFWGCTCTKISKKSIERNKKQEKIDSAESFDSCNDTKQSKKKKPICSPLKKLGRSSLAVSSDKITINLPKYSPCASRLAAGSKILSSDLMADPESPLHVSRSRSPSHVDVKTENPSKSLEQTSMQASLSLNIQQFQKTRYTPRSRSVGDSCVTSPTSEATTVSYSPTGTEILSLEEVGPQTSSAEGSGSYSDVKEKLDAECTDKIRRTTLETKC